MSAAPPEEGAGLKYNAEGHSVYTGVVSASSKGRCRGNWTGKGKLMETPANTLYKPLSEDSYLSPHWGERNGPPRN